MCGKVNKCHVTGEQASRTVNAGVTLNVGIMVPDMEYSRNVGNESLTTKAKQVNTALAHRFLIVHVQK